jgi:hypothetical protein
LPAVVAHLSAATDLPHRHCLAAHAPPPTCALLPTCPLLSPGCPHVAARLLTIVGASDPPTTTNDPPATTRLPAVATHPQLPPATRLPLLAALPSKVAPAHPPPVSIFFEIFAVTILAVVKII